MQRHFNAEPSDYYNAFMYGTVNDRMGNLDESVRVWTLLDSIYPSKLEPAFKLADALSARRDSISLKKAIGIYDRIEQTKGKSIPITSRKMRTYMATLDTASVISEVKKLIAELTPFAIIVPVVFIALMAPFPALTPYFTTVFTAFFPTPTIFLIADIPLFAMPFTIDIPLLVTSFTVTTPFCFNATKYFEAASLYSEKIFFQSFFPSGEFFEVFFKLSSQLSVNFFIFS